MTDAIDPRLLRRAAEQAAEWYLDQREGLDAAQRARFLAWLRQSPLHVSEYIGMARLHGDLGAAAALDALDTAELADLAATERAVVQLRPLLPRAPSAAPVRRAGTPWWQQAIAAVAVALIGGAAFLHEAPAPMDVYTSAGEVRDVALDDGTLLQLDRASAVAVRYGQAQRRFELLRGGALFDVGRDPARPLRVGVGEQVLEDVGTVFDAHRRADGASVAVVSGEVRIWTGEPAATQAEALADLRAGQYAEVAGGRLAALERRADLAQHTAWLPADIHFEHSTVAEVARRFAIYGGTPLHIDDAALAATRISGRFHARDPEAFVAYLGTLPGVRVQRGADDIRITRKL
ncbi:transmembrane sensor [Dyella sp. SG562]|uniref:FecR family protein n=1 Tax=Dyella sp. SG562 TaxID=2587017 RepID=UPI001422B451|nr:FecR domain-containing protein [Dyella sp. SG562]NII72192.1 transmembrane sensor [Dyella sp. SG562]